MAEKKTKERSWWNRFKDFLKTHTNLTVIVVAALLLELTTGVIYYTAQRIIQRTVERLVEREMNAMYLGINNQLSEMEVAVDNMVWVVRSSLSNPESMFAITHHLVENNPSTIGSSICFIPNYFPAKGKWFQPYSGRRADGSIEDLQLGSASHNYMEKEFYTYTMSSGKSNWCEPYLDPDGAKGMVTTYSVPVHDAKDRIVGVAGIDLSLNWLNEIIAADKVYKSTQRFLVTGEYNLLAGNDGKIYQAALKSLKDDNDRNGYVTWNAGNGKKYHIFFHPIGGKTDWILMTVLDDSDIFGKLRQTRLLLFLLVMTGLLIIGFIVYRTSRNLERLREVNAEKERIGGELRVASQIQHSMLPCNHLRQEDVDLYGLQVPAREVGGDLFDYFIRDEKLIFCIGDVSGKGTPSAILMASTRSLFRAFSVHTSNPARIMQAINGSACLNNDTNMFVTLFIGVLDLPTGHLRYCNAGHEIPYIFNTKLTALDCNAHLPVGVFEDVNYEVQEVRLSPDTMLFVYTDGVTEAKNGERKQFGIQRLEDVLSQSMERQLNPEETIGAVREEVHSFVKDAEPSDDITMLAVRYTPQHFESKLNETIILKNDVHEVKKLSDFQKDVYEKMNIDKSLARQLRLAVEEAVVNVMEYAYPSGTEGTVEVRMMSDGNNMKAIIVDTGVPFDPTAMEKTDTTLPAEERQIGGLGILLVRELMDSINYERIEGKNVLTLIKKLNT